MSYQQHGFSETDLSRFREVQRLGRILRKSEGKRAVLYEVMARATREERVAERRRQTLVPAAAATVHGKHQPLQWNIGSVQR